MAAAAERPGSPGGVWHRRTARVLPVRPDGRVLMLHGWDPHRPAEPFWYTVGGAAEGGESMAGAAARELYEETSIRLEPALLGEPVARNRVEFSWGGQRIAQEQVFFAVAIGPAEISLDGMEPVERATTDAWGWLSAEELEGGGDGQGPAHPDLPDLIRAAVASVRARGRTA